MKHVRQSNLVRAAHRAGALVAAMAVLMSLVLMPAPVRAAGIVYVVPGSSGDGSSWSNGKDLQAALTGASSGDELWLKHGTYLPTSGTDRTASFVLKNGVAIYGGFEGIETQRSQRTIAPQQTILSGNIGTTNTFADNSYNVVTADGTNATAVLDNVQIIGGYADGPTLDDQYGGGLRAIDGSPTLRNVNFAGNTAQDSGGGAILVRSQSTMTNITFVSNYARSGGGLYALAGALTLADVDFVRNTADSGGGMMAMSNWSTLTNVRFSSNTADDEGGGMYVSSDNQMLTNVSFSSNTAGHGGGMHSASSDLYMRNSIIWGNTGGQLTTSGGNDPAVVSYSLVQGGFPGTGNIDADPLFVDATAGNLRLQEGSPAINAGSNALLPTGVETDLDGQTRIVGGAVDLGAYEYPTSPAPVLSSISPLATQAGGGDVTLTVVGSNFTPVSTVQWRDTTGQVTQLSTTFNTATQLTALVPAALVAAAQTAEITVVTPAPGGGASDLLPFFVTATDTTVTKASTGSSQDGTATANIDGPSGLTATAAGTGSVSVAEYAANPAGTPSFNSSGVYFDVYLSSGNTFTSVSVVQCAANGGTQAYWWDGSSWLLASHQQYDAATGCITITVNSTTSPSPGDLFGTIFAVGNVAPSVTAITGAPGVPIPAGTAVNITSSFSDPAGALDGPYAVAIDWGDGTAPNSSIMPTSGPISGSHIYTAAGIYTIEVSVVDNQEAHGIATTSQYVVVYDPSAGFVTGGGWIDSPVGAYAADPMLAGKATFGFVSKYQKGATTPTGQTQFRFHAGSLDFHSTAYEWLVIAGAKAQYKGDGLLNGSAGYGFMLTANDGQVSGGGAVDRFRIKIWEKATGSVVYDNQMGDAEDASASTAIEGGSIVVHSK